ncbi:MAG TPA: DNA polymerase I, partial [Rhodospirillales bacterium]|nr:DNA polymerase I [Rhodospirillales bacterium]
VNAVFGFCNMLLKLMQEHPGDDIVVVFDTGKPSFRNEVYTEYKANREAPPREMEVQFPLVREAARAFGLPVLEVEGFEADDVIATLARRAREEGREVVIVSSDKDLMQLVGPGISMWDPMKNRMIGPEEVEERFGVPPERVRDVLALAGDASDNVPGVPGIGIKTAARLIREFGSLEALLANLDRIRQPKRRQTLMENAERARLSYRLVGLEDDVPLPFDLADFRRREPDPAKLLAFFRENGFKSLIARLEQVAEEAAAAHAREAGKAHAPRYSALRETAALEAVLARAGEAGRLAIDLETDSLAVDRARIVGICLAVEAGEGFYLPLEHVDDFGKRIEGQLPFAEVAERLAPVLTDPGILKIGHNLKFDMAILERHGLAVTPHDDTLLVSYVLNGTSHGHGLDELANRYLGYETLSYSTLCGKGASQITFDRVPVDRAVAYGAEDAEVTLRLWEVLRPLLLEERITRVYEGLDRPLVPVVARMERLGIRVDTDRLRELSERFGARMAELEERARELAGRSFNLGSPKQLGEVLFDELGLDGGGRKTRTGAWSTSADVLEELAAQGHELPRVILEWRQLQKLVRTYCDALIAQVNPTTGRVHTSYNLA